MSRPETLTDWMDANHDAPRSITYLEAEGRETRVTFAELRTRALGILHHLQGLGARPGDRVILFLASNEQFIDAWWAGVLGRLVTVPVAIGISDEHRHKLLRIARKLGDPFIYTDRRSLERIGQFAATIGADDTFARLRARAFLADQLSDLGQPGAVHRARPEDVAFIQFSSGSTSEPKGIVLTHANLLANSRGAARAARFSSDDVSLSWMPLTHDMGLIGMHFFMVHARMQVYLMPTELFVRRPLAWLQQATRCRATILSSPNFGYRHYLKVLGDRSYDDLDLSAVRILFNGAEPISADLCEEFLARMEHAGLRRTAMYPVYGLAEATLAVTFPEPGSLYRSVALDRHRLGAGSAVAPVANTDRDALELVSVGRPIPDIEVRLVDDADAEVPPGHTGHILIRGPSVTQGYFEDAAATQSVRVGDGWLRTGDLGVLLDGDLYVTGRAKEIIFVNGQNYYPHDLEAIAHAAPGLDFGKVVAAGVRPRGAQADELVMFVLHRAGIEDFLPIAMEVWRLVNEHAGLEVTEVVPVPRIPKTTSGKIQRHLLERAYVDGEFAAAIAELAALRNARRVNASSSGGDVAARLKAICDAELGRAIGTDENLFEIGTSSLKLIAIHEAIDREYPGQIDLTEMLDFPTIGALSGHLEGKLRAAAG
jgi:acyl-CoA synthetase (AMP-forming)/AMP-acid ligase II/aryl carrier-like protein